MQETDDATLGEDEKAPANRYQLTGTVGADFEDAVSRLSDAPELEEMQSPSAHFSSYERDRAERLDLGAASDDGSAEAAAKPTDRRSGWGSRISKVWREQRAMLYLAAAVGLLAVVIVGWAMQPPAPAGPVASGAQTPAKTELSMVDKMLVDLGLAEAPAALAYQGDPNAKVWVDVHTALYYCQDAELFGRTKGGRFAKQRDAQLDQFQPAAGKACD
jgi:hypothetical protein